MLQATTTVFVVAACLQFVVIELFKAKRDTTSLLDNVLCYLTDCQQTLVVAPRNVFKDLKRSLITKQKIMATIKNTENLVKSALLKNKI